MEMIVMLVVAFLLFSKPKVLVNFTKTTIGRLILIGTMLFALLHSTLCGVFIAILFVMLSEEVFEGMDNIDALGGEEDKEAREKVVAKEAKARYDDFNANKDEPVDDMKALKDARCVDGKFYAPNGKEISAEDIPKHYPNIHFKKNKPCNICDDDCEFKCHGECDTFVTKPIEKLTNMEGMERGESARGVPVPGRGGNDTRA